MLSYKIEEITTSYLDETLELVFNVFMEFEGDEFPSEGVNEFKEYIQKDNITKLLKDNLKIWIATYNENVIGVIASRDINHISLLFVAKQHHRQGIARRLFKEVIDDCNKHHCDEISVNSSLYAREAYQKLGFEDIDSSQTINGISFIPMKMKLK